MLRYDPIEMKAGWVLTFAGILLTAIPALVSRKKRLTERGGSVC